MSFDLHFYPRPGKPPLTAELFRTYFQQRRFFTLRDGWVAGYEHADTGVSFSYALNAPPTGRRQICASFHLNYLRPRAFALEAERLVGWFVEDFGLLVRDPQARPEHGPHSAKRFLRSWEAGNRMACSVLLKEFGELQVHDLPRAELERYWRWNYYRDEIPYDVYDYLERRVGAGTIRLFRSGGRARSWYGWRDAEPVALPVVDYVLLDRDKLAAPGERSRALVPWADLQSILPVEPHRCSEAGQDCYVLGEKEPTAELVRFFRRWPPHPGLLDPVSFEEVIDREVLEEARRAAAGQGG